ncbi:hypothetical protein GCM10027598_19620 [Amycolatopsis oliviviridis]|uniref:Uncharacterized protein n=1 Tax=Amycolatopsis oliviviridis TaxID=1471590 RepID=A0ABQ3LFW2_9PSEU|nr:hypothetical protein GCM10017790_27270 [Amycolatopsis oliviviridis]
MVAELVEVVDVEAGFERIERRSHFLGENLMTETLRGYDFFIPVGHEEGVARRVGREFDTCLVSTDEEL